MHNIRTIPIAMLRAIQLVWVSSILMQLPSQPLHEVRAVCASNIAGCNQRATSKVKYGVMLLQRIICLGVGLQFSLSKLGAFFSSPGGGGVVSCTALTAVSSLRLFRYR